MKKICSLLGLIILLLTSCSDKAIETKDTNKNSGNGSSNATKIKLTKIISSYDAGSKGTISKVKTLQYRADGRLTKVISTFKKNGVKINNSNELILNYGAKNQVTSVDKISIDENGKRTKLSAYYKYNDKGFIISSINENYHNHDKNESVEIERETYTYNSKGQLEKKETTNNNTSSVFNYYEYDIKDNLIKRVEKKNGNINRVATYTYDNKNNPFLLFIPRKIAIIDPESFSKNNVIKEKNGNGEIRFISEYFYNEKDYPTKKIEYGGGRIVAKTEFFYE